MAKQFNATIWVEGGWLKLRWPYDKIRMNPLKDEIKEAIPYSSRKFNGEDKCWHVDPSYDEILMEILERHCDNVAVLGDTTSHPDPVPAKLVSGDAASILIGLCPDKTLPKVWRAIAAALHPDSSTGDQDAFVKATQAWEALRVSRGI